MFYDYCPSTQPHHGRNTIKTAKKKKKSKTVNLIYTGLQSLVSVGFLNLNNTDVLVE